MKSNAKVTEVGDYAILTMRINPDTKYSVLGGQANRKIAKHYEKEKTRTRLDNLGFFGDDSIENGRLGRFPTMFEKEFAKENPEVLPIIENTFAKKEGERIPQLATIYRKKSESGGYWGEERRDAAERLQREASENKGQGGWFGESKRHEDAALKASDRAEAKARSENESEFGGLKPQIVKKPVNLASYGFEARPGAAGVRRDRAKEFKGANERIDNKPASDLRRKSW